MSVMDWAPALRGGKQRSGRAAARGRDNGQFWGRVDERPKLVISGTTLTAAAGPAAAVLTVADAADFNGDGGYLRLRLSETGDFDVAPLTDLVVAYTGWDGDYDDVPDDTITLAAPLPSPLLGAPLGCPVDVWDLSRGAPAQEWLIGVVPDDSDLSAGAGRSLPVEVPPGEVDGLPLGTFPGLGESVLVGPDSETGDEDDLVLIRVKGAKHVRNGTFSPEVVDAQDTAHSAEDRATGRKWAKVFTALVGARAELLSDDNGGLLRIINTLEETVGVIRATVEGGVQRLIVGTGGDNPVRLRFFNGVNDRSIDALCNVFNVFGLIQGTQGLTLQQSPAILKGFDRFTNVTRVTSANGVCQVQHNLAATGSMTQPFVKFSDPDASPAPVGPEDVEMLLDGTEAGGIVRFRVIWRSGPGANRPNGVSGGERVSNRTVTFDYGLESVDR